MNVTQANKIVQTINTIVTGYTSLARAIEDLAWESFEDHAGMPGVRPIAALHQPQQVRTTFPIWQKMELEFES